MNNRSKPWQIAADLEAAAKAVLEASLRLDAIHPSALAEVENIPGTEWIDAGMAKAIQALSDKYQAIADAEPDDGPPCPNSPNRQHQVDTSMESGPNNCFYCERPM